MAKAPGPMRRPRRAKPRGPAKPLWRRKPWWIHPSHGLTVRIRAVCEGRTFDEISKATGVNEENVRRFWHGTNQPSIDFVTSLCLAYGVSAHWLLTGLGPRRLRR